MLFISIPLEFLLNSYARNIVNIGRSLRFVTLYIGEINNGISWKCWYVWIGTQYFIIFCDNNVNTMPLFQNIKLFIFFFISFNFPSPLFQVIRTQHLKVRLFYEVIAVHEIQYSMCFNYISLIFKVRIIDRNTGQKILRHLLLMYENFSTENWKYTTRQKPLDVFFAEEVIPYNRCIKTTESICYLLHAMML